MTTPQPLAETASAPRADRVLFRGWTRLLVPSLSDLFFIALIVWLFLSGPFGWKGLLADGDAGWHIRTGEYILDHGAVPRTDLYSFSKAGAPWFAWEWLADVADAALFRAAGLKGVVLAAAVCIVLFATILMRRIMWRDAHMFVAVIVALLAVGASSVHFLARPHLYTMVLLSASMWIIEADRRRATPWIWMLIPITILWANLHGGFLALIAQLGIACIGAALEGFPAGAWAQAIRYGALAIACAAASVVNPYGVQLHRHMFEFLRSDWIRNTIQEFQSPTFRGENMLQFEVLLIAGLVCVPLLLYKRKITEALWVLFFAHMALTSARHLTVFVIVAAPPIAEQASAWWRAWTASQDKTSLAGIINQISADFAGGFHRTTLWPAAAVAALMFGGLPIQWPTDFPEEKFPVKMVHAHEAELWNSRVLTTDQWGDYLIYLNPSRKVFVDGRSDFYGSEIGDVYLHLVSGQPGWQEAMEKYGFTLVLLPSDMALPELLKTCPDWQVADTDGKHILLVRKATPVPPTGNLHTEPRF